MDEQWLDSFSWTERFCEAVRCPVGRWCVAQHPDDAQCWYVAASGNDLGYTVLAEHPLCPCCGNDLLTLFEVEGGFADDAWPLGPIFDFARSAVERATLTLARRRG